MSTPDQPVAASTPSTAPRDPLVFSWRRLGLLLLGGAAVVWALFVGVAIGAAPALVREWIGMIEFRRAVAGHPAIDFAAAEWASISTPAGFAQDFPAFSFWLRTFLLLIFVSSIAAPLVAFFHIVLVRLAAALAIRADRRLHLGLGQRPVQSLAASIIVGLLWRRVTLLAFACGLGVGLMTIGQQQEYALRPHGLRWLPDVGVIFCLALFIPLHTWLSLREVRGRLNSAAPAEPQVCTACGYLLEGLPTGAPVCPECGRALEENTKQVFIFLRPGLWRWIRRFVVAAAVLALLGFVGLLVASVPSRELAANWLLATRPAAATLPSVSFSHYVIAPKNTILQIDLFGGRTHVAYHAHSVMSNGTPPERRVLWLRSRALIPQPDGSLSRIEVIERPNATGSAALVDTPGLTVVPAMWWIWNTDAVVAMVHAVPALVPGASFSIRFLPDDAPLPPGLTPDDRAWLTAPFEPPTPTGAP